MRLPAYEFSKYVEDQIEALPPTVMRSKNTREAKKLIEELWPLSCLALTLKSPGLNIEVEVPEEESEADGIIYESGFRERQLNIQITYSFDYEESLRVEMINKHGHAPGAGPINRDKKTKKVVAQLTAVDSDEYLNQVTQEVLRLYKKKVEMNYHSKMVLLITFFEFKFSGLSCWAHLYKNIHKEFAGSKNSFLSVYLFNEASNEIYRAA